MSIAAISQSFVSAVRAGTAPAVVEAAEPVRATARVSPREPQGRRQALVDAVYEAMDVEAGAQDRQQTQAVYRFAHALMHDLRAMGGDESDRQAGRALGRQDWGDVGQRLSALAAAASQPKTDAAPRVPEMPQQPNPVTIATAAVHLMKVPSARLLEAFVAMHRALEQQDEQQRDAVDLPDPRGALADLVRKLAQAASAETPIVTQAGALLDIRA